MSERMLNKNSKPSDDEIKQFIGDDAYACLLLIQKKLSAVFELKVELKFPFGNNYGWGYKYSHKTKHLFYIFFESRSITLMIHITEPTGDIDKELLNKLSDNGKSSWANKYPCSSGGWVYYNFRDASELSDAGIFVSLRTNKSITF